MVEKILLNASFIDEKKNRNCTATDIIFNNFFQEKSIEIEKYLPQKNPNSGNLILKEEDIKELLIPFLWKKSYILRYIEIEKVINAE